MSAAARRALAPLAVVTAAAFVFELPLVLVRPQWAPLESADHGAAARLNSLVAGHAVAIGIVKAVTWLGSGGVLTLDPVLKALVGRLRPVVAHRIAYGKGDSFPGGHALGSIVCYGALFLVFLHYLSYVLGAWALGITWLGVTAFAFELSRQAAGAPVTDPVTEGLEPEAAPTSSQQNRRRPCNMTGLENTAASRPESWCAGS
jgi:undecaprenyl-diphosphatase